LLFIEEWEGQGQVITGSVEELKKECEKIWLLKMKSGLIKINNSPPDKNTQTFPSKNKKGSILKK
jgi:hypothetical protein